ncbi:DNA-binding protein [Chelatococcus sp. GCM10030263]|uniref:DNA-binding protein n=1 Tax=Chelatococcus sp. GCM10030263 TaxID=3273387 RepID=UPI00361B831C
MSTNLAGLPPRYLRTPEASRFVGLSIRTLEKHRIYGMAYSVHSSAKTRFSLQIASAPAGWTSAAIASTPSRTSTESFRPCKRSAALALSQNRHDYHGRVIAQEEVRTMLRTCSQS